jgi:hypothetical protein
LAILATVAFVTPGAFAQETLTEPEKPARAEGNKDKTTLVKNTKERNLEAEVERLQLALDQALQRLTALEALQVRKVAEEKKADAAKAASPSVKFSGYVQAQYLRESGEGTNVTRADVRRGRIKLDAQLSPAAALTLQTENALGGIELRDANVDLTFNKLKMRAGQFKVPLSFQILESSGVRLTPERALINTRSVPGERDRGVLFDVPLNPDHKAAPLLQLGVFNGRGINQQSGNNQTSKDLVAALFFPTKPVSGRIALLTGKFTNDAANNVKVNKRRLMFDVQYDQAPWNVQLQFGTGKGDFRTAGGMVSATDVRGGYFQVAHKPKESKFTLLARYQQYDPDTDTGGNTINGPLFGIVYDATDKVRYVVAVERLDDDSKSGHQTILTFRTQVRY